MRHGMHGRKLGRNRAQRRSLFAGLVNALIKHEQIKTTLPKAKDLQAIVEKIITTAKKGGLANRRNVNSILRNDDVEKKLFTVIAERYAKRPGGYTRVMKAGFRYGDSAAMAVIELVDRDVSAKGLESGPTAEKNADKPETAAA